MNKSQLASVIYHDVFGFALIKDDLVRWQVNPKKIKLIKNYSPKASLDIRKLREKSSQHKLRIAQKAANVLQKIPTVKFVGITGSLAMMNAKPEADIDLLIITSHNTLWISRVLVYLLLKASNFAIRNPSNRDERDKLCLNMWMDEEDLKILQKNIYTAHEIAQIIPLVNKKQTYEKFIAINKWIFDYWPNAIKGSKKIMKREIVSNFVLKRLNEVAFCIQYFHMKRKMTREQVSLTRAFFHPFDWGEKVLVELATRGLEIKK